MVDKFRQAEIYPALSLVREGRQINIDKADEEEKEKRGTLRGGNTGMMDEEGNIFGQCAAMTYLRFKGIQSSTSLETELMFAGGRANEDCVLKDLAAKWDGPIKQETEIPVIWRTPNNTFVTGRPDIIYGQGDSTYFDKTKGLELKQLMSINSAYNVLVKREPQTKHLLQTAHYSWQHDIPFELMYTNRGMFDMPSWMEFRQHPHPTSKEGQAFYQYRYHRLGEINPRTNRPIKHQVSEQEYMENYETNKKYRYTASKLTPQDTSFFVAINDGKVYYKDSENNEAEWVPTVLTVAGIKRFYDYISRLEEQNKVPPPAHNIKPDGSLMGWKFSQYSSLGDLDPEHCQGQPLDEWVEKARNLLEFG